MGATKGFRIHQAQRESGEDGRGHVRVSARRFLQAEIPLLSERCFPAYKEQHCDTGDGHLVGRTVSGLQYRSGDWRGVLVDEGVRVSSASLAWIVLKPTLLQITRQRRFWERTVEWGMTRTID